MNGPQFTADGATGEWTPSVERREDVVTQDAAGALHDLLDRSGERPSDRSPLPPLWHWLAFLPQARQGELGPDGHPQTGTFLPPMQGRARMYAGGRIRWSGPVCIGEPIARTSSVTKVTHKEGRTGDLVLVTVQHDIRATLEDKGIAEEQDLVYRPPRPPRRAASSQQPVSADPDANRDWPGGRDIQIEPSLLFRFSALTYNAHRIHYDRDYATTREGYPGLVVHGPLQAILLADAIFRAYPHGTLSEFSFRAVAPAFDDHPLKLRLAAYETDNEGTHLELHAFSGSRHTMSATAHLSALSTSI